MNGCMNEWTDKTQRCKQSETTPTPQRDHTAQNRSCNTVGLPSPWNSPSDHMAKSHRYDLHRQPRPLPACLRTIATGRIYNPQPHDLATGDAVPAHRTNNVNTGLMNRPSLEGHMVPCQIFPVSPLNNKQPCTLNPIGFDKI